MNNLMQDVRYAVRMLWRSPGFTIVAVLTLALGIGANTAIFSFVNSLFLQPLPVEQPQELVRIYGISSEGRRFDVMSYPFFTDLREQVAGFAEAAAHQTVNVSLGTGDTPESGRGELVSGSYFAMMRLRPALGRMLTAEDDRSIGGHPQVVISDGLWRRRFGGTRDVVGKTIHINSHPFTVVGVAPETFRGSYHAFTVDFWAPMAMHEQVRPRGLSLDRRGWGWLYASARMKPGVSVAQVNAQLDALNKKWRAEKQLDEKAGFEVVAAQALPEQMREGVMKGLGAFLLIVGLVLLVACANIASVVLTRVTSRLKEISIRQSLGASRGQLLRQWLVESMMLAALGGLAGAVAAFWLRDAMFLLVPPDFSELSRSAPLDWKVMSFAAALTLVTGLLFGLAPAWRASRVAPLSFLKEGGAGGSQRRSRLFGSFVAGQVAVSMVLLVVSGLLLQSLRNAETFNPGFDSRGLALGLVDLRRHGYKPEAGAAFFEQVAAALRQQPGVESATYANVVPLGPDRESLGFRIPGHTPPPERGYFSIATNVVGSDYFATMKIPVLLGRSFDERDAQPGAAPVIVINEAMARRFWPDKNPVGEMIQTAGRNSVALQIVGVARNIKYYSLGEEPRPYIYGSAAQQPLTGGVFHVRTRNAESAEPRMIRQAVAQAAPGVAVIEAMTFEQMRRVQLFPQRVMAAVTALFGALAMVLTAIGIYGIVSYTVNLRTREMGIRAALGATRQDIYRMVIGRELAVMGVGAVIGVAAATAATRAIGEMLFGVAAFDPLTYAAVITLLLGVGVLACWIPARRAAKVDPVVALRYE